MKTKMCVLTTLLFCFLSNFAAATEQKQTEKELGILFAVYNGEAPGGLYWMSVEGSTPELIVDYDDFTTPSLSRPRANISPDGQHIAVSSIIVMSPYFRFALFDRESETSTRLSRDDIFRKGFYWSPDSQKVAYLTETWGGKFFVIDLESGEEKQLASTYDLSRRGGASFFVSLDWSPDGKSIALSYLQGNGLTSVNDLTIFLLNSDGTNFHRVLKKEDWGFAPSWGSDNILYYICPTRSNRLIQLCALDVGRSLTVHVQDFTTQLPARGFIKTLDVGPDDRMILSFDDGTGHDQIYLYSINTHVLTNLSATKNITGSYPQWFYQ